MTLLFATSNRGKLAEAREIGLAAGIEIVGPADIAGRFGPAPTVEEKGRSYREHAAKKARALRNWCGYAAIGDDTGLEVEALSGAPGLLSARYAGEGASPEENRNKLLGALDGVTNRRAEFICVLVLSAPERDEISVEGRLRGEISYTAQGGGGFGYDSIFFLPELGMTLAQAKEEGKAVETHRVKALKELLTGWTTGKEGR